MVDPRRFETDELLIRPGTYFNPQTEILIVVDDSSELDAEVVQVEDGHGSEWILISDEVPVDEHQRDELLEAFQIRRHPRAMAELSEADDEDEDEDEELDEDEEEDQDEGEPD